MAELKLEAQPRTVTGRKVRQLRSQGLVPVVVYGNSQPAVNLQVNARSLELLMHHGGFSQLVEVNVEGGGTHNVLVREIQRHPITHNYVHVDLYAVDMTEKQHANVPIVRTGKPTAMEAGLMVLQATETVSIEALPADIPANIEVDITALELERPITVADLPQLAGVTYLSGEDEALFTMMAPRVAEVEEEVEEVEEGAEPELVGSDEEEGEEEGGGEEE